MDTFPAQIINECRADSTGFPACYNPDMIPAESVVQEPPQSPPAAAESSSVSVVAAGVALGVLGLAGLAWLIANTLPTIPNRWLFFAFLQIGLMGMALPFVRYLHQRFAPKTGAADNPAVLIRQSAWVGLFGTLCVWLRIPRLLSLPVVLIVLAALVAVEFFFRLRERMQWRPE